MRRAERWETLAGHVAGAARSALVCGAIALACAPLPARAHNPDTSYARFRVSRGALELDLVYDLFTLVQLVPGLDADADRRITAAELARAVSTIDATLRGQIDFEVDERPATFGTLGPVAFPPGVGDAIAEADYHAATSLVTFTYRQACATPPRDFWICFRLFDRLGPRHSVLGSIEHDGKFDEVIFRQFEPDYLYDTGYAAAHAAPQATGATVPVVPSSGAAPVASAMSNRAGAPTATGAPSSSRAVSSPPAPSPPLVATPRRSNLNRSAWDQAAEFFYLGVEHILIGYDHILFLLALVMVSRFWELVKIVTSFTVAHSITLALAALDLVTVNRTLVEIAIAGTIVYAAAENFWIEKSDGRWKLTFAFGLIHGFGFAGVLRDLGLPSDGLARALLAFNLGVEAGQLAIVAALFLPVALARQPRYGVWPCRVVSALVAACGLGWLLDRALGLSLMPF